jgi:hypothetical protein
LFVFIDAVCFYFISVFQGEERKARKGIWGKGREGELDKRKRRRERDIIPGKRNNMW